MREPAQRKGRAFLRPEISRSYTFGVEVRIASITIVYVQTSYMEGLFDVQGVSRAQFFDQYLGNIKLNDVLIDWAAQDLSVLDKVEYDHRFEAEINAARSVPAASIVDVTCGRDGEAVTAEYGTVDTYPDMAHVRTCMIALQCIHVHLLDT
jgi:alpha-1,3-mannosyl-glycoprotein beta-1,2-N-acetylglucosaminyltransferase